MNRLVDRIAPGEWLRDGDTVYSLMPVPGRNYMKNRIYMSVQAANECPDDEQDAVAELVVEALNVAHQSGRSPSELLAERNELAEVLCQAASLYGKPGGPWNIPNDPGGWMDRARAALAKLEKTS